MTTRKWHKEKEGNEGRKYLKAKEVIDATGEEEVIVITDELEGFQLDGSAEGGKEKTGNQCPQRQHKYIMEEDEKNSDNKTTRQGHSRR